MGDAGPYQGIIEEHHAVRTAAGLFDLSHMGELYIDVRRPPRLDGALVTLPASWRGAGHYSMITADDVLA